MRILGRGREEEMIGREYWEGKEENRRRREEYSIRYNSIM